MAAIAAGCTQGTLGNTTGEGRNHGDVMETDGLPGGDATPGEPGDTTGGDPLQGEPDDPAAPFTFVVFGDLNGGGCAKNERLHRTIAAMVQVDADFYVQTGDLIEGAGTVSCFAHDHPDSECQTADESGNMRAQLLPLLNRTPRPGLAATYYPVIGNHDAGWGSDWYPDPCGDGICDFFDMTEAQLEQVYITHGDSLSAPGFFGHSLDHGDLCAKVKADSGFSSDFFYSFAYKSSFFIVLRQHEDYYGMFNCNGHSEYDSCEEFCTDEELRLDSNRNSRCFSIYQYDWLVTELQAARGQYAHIFVFAHAPMLTSSENHSASAGHTILRPLFESSGVDIYFNGHNHAYERTHRVRGDTIDATGTAYITAGVAGALTDTLTTDWFTAASYRDWTSYNNQEEMTTFLEITVDGENIHGRVVSLGAGVVDEFEM